MSMISTTNGGFVFDNNQEIKCNKGTPGCEKTSSTHETCSVFSKSTVAKIDDTNPKDLLGIKKVQLNLVPASSIIYQALAMEDGGVKYGPYNWRKKKVRASIYVAAAMRHIQSWFDSVEELAQDSQKPHLGHAMACLGIIIDAKETGNLVDDRPEPGPASALIERFKK